MARGRFLAKAIADSKRAAKTPDRAYRLWTYLLANSNVVGRIEADAESLLSISGRTAIERGWTRETVEADRDFLARVGLLRVWGSGPDVFAEIVGFFEHNRTRLDREAPSKIPPPPDELPEDSGSNASLGILVPEDSGSNASLGILVPEDSGSKTTLGELPEDSRSKAKSMGSRTLVDSRRTPGVTPRSETWSRSPPAPLCGRTPAQVQDQEEVEGEGEAQVGGTPPGASSSKGDPRKNLELRAEIAQRLLDAWAATWAKANAGSDRKIAPPTLSFPTAERLAKDVPALVWFETVDVLADELRRVLLSCEEKGWKAGRAEWVIEKVGQVFEGVSEPNPVTWGKEEENPKRATISERVSERVDLSSIGREVSS